MSIYKSVKTLITKTNNKNTRTFLTLSTTTTTTTSKPPQHHNFHNPCSIFLNNKHARWMTSPFHGPLFLSSPPWKLSQASTPFLFRGNTNGLVLRRVAANWDLLRINTGRVLGLGCQSVVDPVVGGDEKGSFDSGLVQSSVNLPNSISLSRLISGPFIGWMIVNEMYSTAFIGLAISGVSDWLDGYVARKMGINSVVGSYLDPLADKVLIGSVAFAMVKMDLLHPGLVGLVVVRDVALVGGSVYHRARSLDWTWNSWYDFFNLDGTQPEKVEPLFISKVNTVFQLALVAAALLQPEFGTQATESYITYLSCLVACTTVGSAAAYANKYMKNRSALLARKS